jgi:hypothetical protein
MQEENCSHDSSETGNEQTPISGGGSLTEADSRKENEETAEGDEEAKTQLHSPQKPSLFQRFMARHFPEAKAHDRWTLVFTAIIATSTFLYTIFAGWTLYEIWSSSTDTHTLALAAKKQADKTEEIAGYASAQALAAEKNAKAAESFSATAGLINASIGDAVRKLQEQAQNIESARESSTDSSQKALQTSIANARSDLRAYIVATMHQEPIRSGCDYAQHHCVDFQYVNVGRTPAVGIEIQAYVNLDQTGGNLSEKATWKACP